jgi:hypothetical protein
MAVMDGGNASTVIERVIDAGLAGSVVDDLFDGNDEPVVTPPEVNPPGGMATTVRESRTFWLESLDGQVVVPLTGRDRFMMPGATGLNLPPVDVVTSTTPGMVGSWLQEVNVLQREVFLPLFFASDVSQETFFAQLAELREMVTDWDSVDVGSTGTFRLGVSSSVGERLLDVMYVDGWSGSLGGDDSGASWERFGLTLLAVDPYWRARNPVVLEFAQPVGDPFLGDGSGVTPWPRRLTPSVVIGAGMKVLVEGDVPVWPDVVLRGPAVTASVSYAGTNIVIPAGVPNSGVLELATDPRRRSARLDGQIAWSRISMGSTFSPLRPGLNTMNVALSASGAGTALLIQYVPGFKSAY